ncbi:MAG: penicillin-binding transpeptidase domain-containing protein [Candidatus Cardinium sp.]|nr:penicillin-binding transpeptidase domain-containing protein [Candidatus Cardinium sp.]
MAAPKDIVLRARVTLLSVVLVMLVITGKIIYLQFLQKGIWRHRAQTTQLAYKPIAASRGNIYADDGSLLATSLPFYTVALDPTIVSEALFQQAIVPLSQKLADFYGDAPPTYYKMRITEARNAKRKYVCLNRKCITYQEKKKMLQWPIFRQGKFKGGVIFEEQYKRYNPFQELARRTIGTHKETASTGLEYAFNKWLSGRNGQALYQKITGGNWKPVEGHTMVRPMHGGDITTTIDIQLQDVTHSSLQTVLEQTNAQHGCAIVMEVATGAIKAMANLSRMPSGKYIEAYNYAVGHQGSVEPGSIFKLVSMLALLEETGWALTEPIDTGEGKVKFYNSWMRDVKKGGYGLLTLQELFEKSSNVGFALVTQQLFGTNPQKFINYIEQLNLHRPLGIELMGEGRPYVVTPKSKSWSLITLPWLSIGYNIQLTPLQLLALYNAVANKGKMVKPRLVQSIQAADGTIQRTPIVTLKEKICSEETLGKLKIMLEGTVERGLAQRIKHGFYTIAGKTGTAEKLVNGRYTNNHLTSFAGYFPANNPRYSCIIMVDSPQGEKTRFGAEVPAPIFKDIADRLAGKDLQARIPINGLGGIQATKPLQLSNKGAIDELVFLYQSLQLPLPTTLQKGVSWGTIAVTAAHATCQPAREVSSAQEVPNVLHMQLRDALFLLEKNGLEVTAVGPIQGNVCKQSLPPYQKIEANRSITITVQ